MQLFGRAVIASSGSSAPDHPRKSLHTDKIIINDHSSVVVRVVEIMHSCKPALYPYTFPGIDDSPKTLASLYIARIFVCNFSAMKVASFNVHPSTAPRGQQLRLAQGAATGEFAGVPVDGFVPLQENESEQRTVVSKLNALGYTSLGIRVLADQLKNERHAVRDVAKAHAQELASQLCPNGYVYSCGVMSDTELWMSPKSFGTRVNNETDASTARFWRCCLWKRGAIAEKPSSMCRLRPARQRPGWRCLYA